MPSTAGCATNRATAAGSACGSSTWRLAISFQVRASYPTIFGSKPRCAGPRPRRGCGSLTRRAIAAKDWSSIAIRAMRAGWSSVAAAPTTCRAGSSPNKPRRSRRSCYTSRAGPPPPPSLSPWPSCSCHAPWRWCRGCCCQRVRLPARPSTQLSVTTKRHADRHTRTKMRHTGVIAMSQNTKRRHASVIAMSQNETPAKSRSFRPSPTSA